MARPKKVTSNTEVAEFIEKLRFCNVEDLQLVVKNCERLIEKKKAERIEELKNQIKEIEDRIANLQG